MTGGGFGGAAIALVRLDDLSRIQVAVDNAFGKHGYGQPDTFVITASDGAVRNQLLRRVAPRHLAHQARLSCVLEHCSPRGDRGASRNAELVEHWS